MTPNMTPYIRTDVRHEILVMLLPTLRDKSLLDQFQFWIRLGMGERHPSLLMLREEILNRMPDEEEE